MDKELFEELRDRFDERYKKKDDCDNEMKAVNARLAENEKQFAVINTKLTAILWILTVVGSAVIGFLVKFLFGG